MVAVAVVHLGVRVVPRRDEFRLCRGGAVAPISWEVVAQFVAEQGDDTVLRGALGLADGAHSRRILPVRSSCIMPCLIWRAFASLASSAAISASMSKRTLPMAACSAGGGT